MSGDTEGNAPRAVTPNQSLLPAALRGLIVTRYRSNLRRLVGGSAKKNLFTVIGAVLIGLYLLSVVASQSAGGKTGTLKPETVALWMPVVLLLMLTSSLLTQRGRTAVFFTAPEIDLVVPGPFSRRQLVLYKIAYQFGPCILLGFWMAIFARRFAGYFQAVVAITLTFQMFTLMAMAATAVVQIVWSRAKPLALGLGGAAVLAGIFGYLQLRSQWPTSATETLALATRIRLSLPVEIILAPLAPYVRTFAAESIAGAVPWALLAAGLNALLICLLVVLDKGEVETLVSNSQNALAKAERFKKFGAFAPRKAGAILPMPARLAGIGPLAWRQMVPIQRTAGKIGLIAFPCGVAGLGYFFGAVGGGALGSGATAVIMAVFALISSVVGSMILRCDFRSDLDHIAFLKTLPMAPVAVVCGQLLTPAVLIAGAQVMLLAGFCLGQGSVAAAPPGLGIVVLSLPLAVLLLSVDNGVFLVMPTRAMQRMGQAGFDPAMVGRHFVVTLIKMLIMAVVVGVGAVPILILRWMGAPDVVGIVAAGAVLLALCPPALYAVAAAFKGFDVAADQPA